RKCTATPVRILRPQGRLPGRPRSDPMHPGVHGRQCLAMLQDLQLRRGVWFLDARYRPPLLVPGLSAVQLSWLPVAAWPRFCYFCSGKELVTHVLVLGLPAVQLPCLLPSCQAVLLALQQRQVGPCCWPCNSAVLLAMQQRRVAGRATGPRRLCCWGPFLWHINRTAGGCAGRAVPIPGCARTQHPHILFALINTSSFIHEPKKIALSMNGTLAFLLKATRACTLLPNTTDVSSTLIHADPRQYP
ncbi:hypothetical protein BC828DRAFT_383314, partial [Blastocladiella britannica]